ncbi:MAG: hypothetical protein GX937_06445 [Lentisphaerae bacterium]|nr:hypothetical protein [Lentisphaerota bacterium]
MHKILCLAIFLASLLTAADNHREAEVFFKEYLAELPRLQKAMNSTPEGWSEAGKKIAAAVALAPDNWLYAHCDQFHRVCGIHARGLSHSERTSLYRRFLADARQFKKTFPVIPDQRFRSVFRNPHFQINPFPTHRFTAGLSAEERREMIDIFADLRTMVQAEEMERIDQNADRFQNQKEVFVYLNAVTTPLEFIIDNHTAFQLSHAAEKEFLRRYANSPGLFCQYYNHKNRFPMVMEERHDDFDTTFALLKKLLDDQELFDLLQKIKQKEYDARRLELLALKQYVNSNLTPEALLKILIDYFRALETCIGREITTKDVFQYTGSLRDASQWILGKVAPKANFSHLAKQAIAKYCDNSSDDVSDLEFLVALGEQRRQNNAAVYQALGEIRSRAAGLRQLKSHLLLRGNPADIAYQMVANDLYNLAVKESQTTIEELFPAFIITFHPFPHFNIAEASYHSLEGCGNQDGIFLLDMSRLFHFSFASRTYSERARLSNDFPTRQRRLLYDDAGYCLAITAEAIGIYDISQNRWTLIRDLSGDDITGAAIVSDRLYYLCGGSTIASHIALHSCDLQGNRRKMHFSTRRRGGVPELPGVTVGSTTDLVKYGRDRLIFSFGVMQGSQGGICEFDTTAETLRWRWKMRLRPTYNMLQKMPDGRILGTAFHAQYFILKDDRPELFLAAVEPGHPAIRSTRYHLAVRDGWVLQGLLTAEDILINPHRQLYVNLKDPAATPSLWLPQGDSVLPLGAAGFAIQTAVGIYTFENRK